MWVLMIYWKTNVGGSNHGFCYSQSENNPSEHLKTGQQGTKGLLNNGAFGQWYGRYSDYGWEFKAFALQSLI